MRALAAAWLLAVGLHATADDPTFVLREVRLDGNTALPAETVERLTAPLVGTRVGMVELNGLRHALTDAYVDAGYVNSGVVIPDQDITDGRVVLRAIEGRLAGVEVGEGVHLRPAFVEQRLRAGVGTPLSISDVQLSLLELERDPLIERVQARLVPGEVRGEAVLQVEVEEASPLSVGIGADNHRSPSIGARQVNAWVRHESLTGRGDVLHVAAVASSGDDGGSVSYRLPVGGAGHAVSAYASRNESEVVVAPFDRVDVESEVDAYGLQLDWSLRSTRSSSLTAFAAFEVKHSETFLLGRPFSFSLGAEDGESDASILSLGAEYVHEGDQQAFAVRGAVREGLDVLDATSIGGAPDGEFTAVVLQGFWARQVPFEAWPVGDSIELRGWARLQWTEDSLQAFEKMALGGADTVRGYVENTLLKDRAALVSLEAVLPLVASGSQQLALVPFVDWARGEDELQLNNLPKRDTLVSAGLGLDWSTRWGLDVELFWGHSFSNRPPATDEGLQGDGIHLMVNWEHRL